MRQFAKVFGVLLVVAGAVWVLQGLNIAFAPQSFMSGNSRWVAYGGTTVLVGLGIATYGFRSSR